MEWKRATLGSEVIESIVLETFLSGMETRPAVRCRGRQAGLETFLSGMETGAGGGFRDGAPALKPSLVEWKQVGYEVVLTPQHTLKPSLVEWKLSPDGVSPLYLWVLETFLSGMETDFGVMTNSDGSVLETFLSGMETVD